MAEEEKQQEAQRQDLASQIEEKDCKIEEQKNQILRLMADFDNFKKRAALEREEIICFSNEALILALLPILDNFDRAMVHSENEVNHTINEEILKGFALIKKQLEDILHKIGLSPVESVGKQFDPHFHEAVMTREAKNTKDGVILEEMQKGYKLKDKVIRPSMVIVSKKGEKKDE